MSAEAVQQIVERMASDTEFGNMIRSGDEGALASYDLTPDERTALLNNDAGQLRQLGVDERVMKAAAWCYAG